LSAVPRLGEFLLPRDGGVQLGLLTVIVIGRIVENLIFRTIEHNTVQKWGTQSWSKDELSASRNPSQYQEQ
jgi:hypothetical protein